MQFSLAVLVGIVVVSAVIFAGIRIIQESTMAEDMAFGILGWFLLAALALIVAGTQWKAAQNYKLYLNEVRRSSDENRAQVQQLITLQEQMIGLLQEILGELRKGP